MALCKMAPVCWFYRREAGLPAPSLELIRKYCNGNYERCARYQFAQMFGNFYVPRGLQPDEMRLINPVLHALIY